MTYSTYIRADGTKYKGYTKDNGYTVTNFKEVSEEEYNRMKAMPYGELSAEVESKLSQATILGYGYYGCELVARDGMFFLGITTGKSCD